jgi:hypothetical protein
MRMCKTCCDRLESAVIKICYGSSPSGQTCVYCGVPLTKDRVDALSRLGSGPGPLTCIQCSKTQTEKAVAEAGWKGHATSTAQSRFHKGSWYIAAEYE